MKAEHQSVTITRRFDTIIQSNLARKITLPLCYLAIIWVVGGLIAMFDRNPSRPDWIDHWNRVLQILDGHWLSEPDPLGSGVHGAIISTPAQAALNNMAIGDFVPFANTAINSPYTYWPSLLSDGHYVRAGAITLVCCSAMIAIAIYLAGAWRHVLLATALLPTVLLSMTFPTADAVSNATAFLFIGAVLYGWQKEEITWRYIIGLTVIAVMLGQSKVTFNLFVLLLLPFLFRKRREWRILIAFVATPLSYLVWSKATSQLSPAAAITLEQYHDGFANFILHPWKVITTAFLSYVTPVDMTGDWHDLRRNIQIVTGSEGNTLLPLGVMFPIFIAFMLLILLDKPLTSPLFKSTIAVVSVLFCVATPAALVLSAASSTPGLAAIGLQSRYFVPVIPLLSLLLPDFGLSISRKTTVRVSIAILVLWTYAGLLLAHLVAWPVVG